MKINFKEFEVYDTLDKTTNIKLDVSKDLANGLYKTAQGISGHALALKIYNSTDQEEYDKDEFSIIMNYANTYGTPFFIDSLKRIENELSTVEADK